MRRQSPLPALKTDRQAARAALRDLPGAADDRRKARRPQTERRPNSPFLLVFTPRNLRTPDRNSSGASING